MRSAIIQRRATELDSRVVSIGQLVLFSSESGDAWMLDPSEHLAVRLASDGPPEPIHIEDTETTFTVAGTGQYRIVGPAFLYSDRDSGRATTLLGYPTLKVAYMGATGTSWGPNAFQLLSRVGLKFQISLASRLAAAPARARRYRNASRVNCVPR